MITIIAISVIIIAIVLILSVVTTSKAYTYKHTVDPIDANPHSEYESDALEKETDKE